MGDVIPFPRKADPLLTKRQLAVMWRCSPRTIERYDAAGMPSEIVNGLKRYSYNACEAWFNDQESSQLP